MGKEQRALEFLAHAQTIIKATDKGGALRTKLIITEVQRQLSDPSFYQRLLANPTLE